MNAFRWIQKYAYYYLYAISVTLVVAHLFTNAVTHVSTQETASIDTVIIDPGHGGMDGGAVSFDGTPESQINLEISLRLKDAFHLLGYDAVLLRTGNDSLETEGRTIREKKMSDLKNRVKRINENPNCFLISIHQNHFTQEKYFGPQVFFSGPQQAQELSFHLQHELNRICAPTCTRQCKPASGVYLMEHINVPGVLIECGFLSNHREAQLLRQPEYQRKLSGVISATTAAFLHNGIQS